MASVSSCNGAERMDAAASAPGASILSEEEGEVRNATLALASY